MSTALTASEKANIAFKQIQGVPSTSDARETYEEPLIFARSAVLLDQIWGDSVPSVAPSNLQSLGDTDLDNNGFNMEGSLAGRTDGNVTRYIKVKLEPVVTGEGQAYRAPISLVSHPDGNSGGSPSTGQSGSYNRVTRDMIPYNYDPAGSYLPVLYRSNGTVISTGFGQWVINIETGIVTFYRYQDIAAEVDPDNPPRLSFYRYTGSKGISVDAGTIFAGNESSTGDDLAALYVSNSDPAGMNLGQFTSSLNFGTSDGSYRFTVAGGAGDPGGTSLHLQKRISGSWVTRRRWI